MTAIPDAGGAQGASCGVSRAVLRVAVLGGLVIAGWLLGFGIGQAHEDLVEPQSVGQLTSAVSLIEAPPTEEGAGDAAGAPTTVQSALAGVLRAVPAPPLPIQPPVQPAQIPALAPVFEPVSNLVAPAVPNSAPAPRSRLVDHQPVAVPLPAEPAAPSAAPAHRIVGGIPAESPAPVRAGSLAGSLPDQAGSVLQPPLWGPVTPSDGPVAPVPASPPATTAPSPGGNVGGGYPAHGDPSISLSDGWATAGLTSMHCRRCPTADGGTPSPAHRPSTSPD
ncbi:MAG: hypothetical protein ACRDSR_25375 [Pseudonocardiaceae bacterium]